MPAAIGGSGTPSGFPGAAGGCSVRGVRYDLHSLDLFRTVATVGSIAGTAARHNTVPSAVSRRMAELERTVGTPLLYRQRRGVALTQAGEDLLRHARTLHHVVERMEADMGDHAGGVRGTVRLAANTSSITQFLPEDLAAFTRDHPQLRIRLIEQTSIDVVEGVRGGHVDLGVYSGFTEADGLRTVRYREDRLVIAAPGNDPLGARERVRLAELIDRDFVGLQQGSSIQTYLERQVEALGGRVRTRVEVMSFDGVRRMVAAGLGLAVLPEGAVAPFRREASLVMIPLEESWATRELRIAYRDPGTLSPPARLLLTALGVATPADRRPSDKA